MEIITIVLNLFAIVGSIAAGKTSDSIGRRYTMILTSTIFMFSAILLSFGPMIMAIEIYCWCFVGIGMGFALVIAPLYIA